MKIQQVKIDGLKPSNYNPRKWNQEQIDGLKASISEYGLVDPIIVNSNKDRKNIVIGGHFRLFVAKEIGFKEVPVNYVDLDEEKEKLLNIVLNNQHISGDWIPEQALSQLSDIKIKEPELFDSLNLEPLEKELEGIICDIDEEENEDSSGDEDWVHFSFGDIEGKVVKDVYDIFRSVYDRVGNLCETDKPTPIIEAICANVTATPDESLI